MSRTTTKMFAHQGGMADPLLPSPGHDTAGWSTGGPDTPIFHMPNAASWGHSHYPGSSFSSNDESHHESLPPSFVYQNGVSPSPRRVSFSGRTPRTTAGDLTSPAPYIKQSPELVSTRVKPSFEFKHPDPPKPIQKRKAKPRGTPPKKETAGGGGGGGGTKRTKFLERNRLAASKCREKKKVWLHELEETKIELEIRHKGLREEYETLMEEVTRIKNSLVSHACCSDPRIDSWIRNEARSFVKRAAERPLTPCSSSLSQDYSFERMESPAYEAGRPLKRRSINFDHMPDDLSD